MRHFKICKVASKRVFVPVSGDCLRESIGTSPGMNGEMVYDTCFRPADKTDTPYIRISTGDYESLVAERGRDNALAAILCSMASMLTHYYQWVHDMDDLTEEEEEQQADQYANLILTAYAQTCDHP